MTTTLETTGERSTLRFERQLEHDIDRVWRAVTDPDELVQWFPSAVIYEPRPGAPMHFDFGGTHGIDVLPGEVREWEPPRVFAFRWDEDELRFELEPAPGGGTKLVFTHSFPHEAGKPARDAAGWSACFERFDALLAGGPPPPEGTWAQHHEDYLARFGELSVEGPEGTRRVRLRGRALKYERRTAVLVELDDLPGVLIVRDRDVPLRDGAAVEVREGTVETPGELVTEGVLRDPLAARR